MKKKTEFDLDERRVLSAKMIAEGVRALLQAIRHGVQALIPIFLLLLYTVLGAVIFYYVESPNERTELETLKRERAELLEVTNNSHL